jgi:hypothetical protein
MAQTHGSSDGVNHGSGLSYVISPSPSQTVNSQPLKCFGQTLQKGNAGDLHDPFWIDLYSSIPVFDWKVHLPQGNCCEPVSWQNADGSISG